MKRFIVFTLLAVLSFGLFVSCGGEATTDNTNNDLKEQLPLLKVGHVNQDHHLALYVAALKGDFFKKDGVWMTEIKPKERYTLHTNDGPIAEIQLIVTKGGAEMPNNLLAGLFDIGFGGLPAVMGVVDKGKDVRVLMPLQNEGDQLIVEKEMPVENWDEFVEYVKNSDEQVVLGYKAPTAVQYIIAQKAFSEVGISYTEDPTDTEAMVLWVNQKGQKNMTSNLAAGQIDGFVANQPTPAQAIISDVGKFITELTVLPPEGMWAQHPCCVVCSNERVKTEHPEAVKHFLKLIMLATDHINDDMNDAIDTAYEFLGQKEGVEDLSIPTVSFSNEDDEIWRGGLVTWANVMNEIGKYSGDLMGVNDETAVDMCVDFTFLEELKKELGK